MALVDKHQKVFGKIVEEGKTRLSGAAPVEVARIIFHARAVADFTHHFQIVFGAFFQPLRLQQLTRVLERLYFPLQILGNNAERGGKPFAAHGVVACREDNGVL